ncbi:hypothetical protein D3C75_942790 [compost metagenome]
MGLFLHGAVFLFYAGHCPHPIPVGIGRVHPRHGKPAEPDFISASPDDSAAGLFCGNDGEGRGRMASVVRLFLVRLAIIAREICWFMSGDVHSGRGGLWPVGTYRRGAGQEFFAFYAGVFLLFVPCSGVYLFGGGCSCRNAGTQPLACADHQRGNLVCAGAGMADTLDRCAWFSAVPGY